MQLRPSSTTGIVLLRRLRTSTGDPEKQRKTSTWNNTPGEPSTPAGCGIETCTLRPGKWIQVSPDLQV
ncbi:hypothetical protein GN956_G18207 [Arapaima gigas]